ncbi:MAG: hypothetical protein M1815_004460 [Lichina confinis]|nr:MAG: hypothetical protein M1815_004460 [Lichina confinis]
MATPYPASTHHSRRSVDPDEALKLLQVYLVASETKAWLHPDAILGERGPRIAGTMEGGLTHQRGWDAAVGNGMYEPTDMPETENETVFPSLRVHDAPEGGGGDEQAVPSTVALAAVEEHPTSSPGALDDHAREENRSSSETALQQPQIPAAALSKEAKKKKKAKADRKEARRLQKEKR